MHKEDVVHEGVTEDADGIHLETLAPSVRIPGFSSAVRFSHESAVSPSKKTGTRMNLEKQCSKCAFFFSSV